MESEDCGFSSNRPLPEDIKDGLLEDIKKGTVSEADWLQILSRYELLPEVVYLMVSAAARRNQFDTVQLLVDHGCLVNAPAGMTSEAITPYEYAVLNDNLSMQKWLLAIGADPKLPNPLLDFPKEFINSIFAVIIRGDLEAAGRILSRFKLLPEDGYLMMGVAAKSDNLDMAKLLLTHGCPVNASSSMPVLVVSRTPTPLAQAILNKSLYMGRFLLENGAVM